MGNLMGLGLRILRMVHFIMGNFNNRMLKGLGFIFLRMGLFIRVGFLNLSLMGLGHFVIRIIGWNIKDISWMENHMEKVLLLLNLSNMKDGLKMVWRTNMEDRYLQMRFMKENFVREEGKEKEYFIQEMQYIQETLINLFWKE